MLIARRCFFFTALQFLVITSYTVSLRRAKKKQRRTLNTIQLRILDLITAFQPKSYRNHSFATIICNPF